MLIVLLRHGIAVDRADPQCPPDAQRPLTERGRRRTREAAAGLAALGVRPEVILTSPLLRAVETAQIAAQQLRPAHEEVRSTPALLPAGDPAVLWAEVRSLSVRSALCVGHAPQLDAVIAQAVGCGRPFTQLKKAGAACLEADDGPAATAATLQWIAGPRLLRGLGGLPR